MNKVKEFLSDYYKVGMVILDLFLLASMWFNPELQFTHFTYFSIVSRVLFPFIVLFCGNKGIWIYFFIVTNVNALDITFDDFTALSAICILFLFIPQNKRWLKIVTVLSYMIDVFIVATLHHRQPYHLFAHFIGCGMLVLSVYKLKDKKNNLLIFKQKIELDLNNDEILILEELLTGKQQKEIEQFSQNTVCRKLKDARLRNNLTSNDELLNLYRESKV